MKKFLSIVLAMLLMLSMSVSALAQETATPKNSVVFGELEKLPDDGNIQLRYGRPSNTGIDIQAYNYNTGGTSAAVVSYRWAGIPAASATIGQSNINWATANGFNGWAVTVGFKAEGTPKSYNFSVDGQNLASGPISAGNYQITYYTPMFNTNQQYKIILDGSGMCWGNIFTN